MILIYYPLIISSELAFQIADQFNALGSGVNLKMCVAVGGMGKSIRCI
jgi:superfamily II DNA/RNA helicase